MFRFLLVSFGTAGVLVLGFWLVRWLALQKPLTPEKSKFFTTGFQIVAHRGGAGEAPENTLEAFQKAATISPEIFVEMDIHLSKDLVPVVIHDPTLERTTDGQGRVREKTLAELQKYDAGFHFTEPNGETSYRGKSVKIPTLDQVLEALPSTRLILEIKTDQKGVEKAVVDVINKHKASKRVMIGSSKSSLLTRFKQLSPDWNYCASQDEVLRGIMLVSMYIEPAGSFPSPAFLIPEKEGQIRVLSERLLKELQRRGKKVLIWTVNEEADMKRLIDQGVDGLISDFPTRLYNLNKGR